MNSTGTRANPKVSNLLNPEPFDDFELDDDELLGIIPQSKGTTTIQNSVPPSNQSSIPSTSSPPQNSSSISVSKENRFQHFRRKTEDSLTDKPADSKNNTSTSSSSPSVTVSAPLRSLTLINDDDEETVEQPTKKQKIEEKELDTSVSLFISPPTSPDLTQKSPHSKFTSPKHVTIAPKPQILSFNSPIKSNSPSKEKPAEVLISISGSKIKDSLSELLYSPTSSPVETSPKKDNLSDTIIRRKIPGNFLLQGNPLGPIGNLPSPKKNPVQLPNDLASDSSDNFIDSGIIIYFSLKFHIDFTQTAWCAMMQLMKLPPYGNGQLKSQI